jgi:hypothetical protein
MKARRALLTVTLLAIALSSSSNAQSPTWVTFHGTAKTEGSSYILNSSSAAGGAILISKLYVKLYEMHGQHIRVKVGAPAKILTEPTVSEPASAQKVAANVAACHEQADCPTKCCACIGAIRVCCGSGEIRGLCVGDWRCPQ